MNINNKGVNVAPSSDEGHYIKGGNVVLLDEVNETFFVRGASTLHTKNHTTLNQSQSCLITCQVEYDPFAGRLERVID